MIPVKCAACGQELNFKQVRPLPGIPARFQMAWECVNCGQRATLDAYWGPVSPFEPGCRTCGTPTNGPGPCLVCGSPASELTPVERADLANPLVFAKVAFAKGDFARGNHLLNEVLTQDISNLEAWELKLALARQAGNPQAPFDLLTSALKHGAPAQLSRFLAEWHVDQGNLEEAVAALTVFLTESEASMKEKAEELSNLGNILAQLGRTADAEMSFSEAISADPVNPRLLQNYAAFQVENGQLEEALATCEQGLLVATDDREKGVLLQLQGYLHAQMGELELAVATIDLAHSIAGNDVQGLSLKAAILIELGQPEEAKSVLMEVLEMDPGHGYAAQLLASLPN